MGTLLRDLALPQQSLAAIDRALALDPAMVDAHVTRAQLLLLQGNYAEGWEEFRWRWRTPEQPPLSSLPLWDGSPLNGRTILLTGEQGLGDTIHFLRFARMVHGGPIVLAVQRGLLRLLRGCPSADRVVPIDELPLPADVYAPLGDLPRMFAIRADSIAADIPYLKAPPAEVERWRTRLDQGRKKVGIVWQGNPRHYHDRWRSLPLKELKPLAEVPGIQLVSLQKGRGREQLSELASSRILDLGEETEDFLDLAALLENLDLLIACDTGPVHLAGALGLPVWLALSAAPDWRWFADRSVSPWYPNVRLFRQTTLGQWTDVVMRMVAELRQS